MSPTPQTTPIDGALVVPLTKHEDSRGWFLEARKESWFRELGGKPSLQTNIVYSRQGVIRGLHFHELGQDDLFFCAQGMVRVVLFDRREDSPTHGTAWSIDIGDEKPCAVYVPGRTAHEYNPDDENTFPWNDERVAHLWSTDSPILSARDVMDG